MRVIHHGALPVIEATAEELAKLATAATGAMIHQEAVVFHGGHAQIGLRLVDAQPPDDDTET